MAMKLIKRSLLLLGAVLLVTLPAYSQNDDVFEDDIYTSRKEIRKQNQAKDGQNQEDEYGGDTEYAVASDRDIDAYNRRDGQSYDGKKLSKDKKKRDSARSSVPGRYSRRLARFYKPNTIVISGADNVYVTDDGECFVYGDEYYDDASSVNIYINSPWYDPFPYTSWYPSFSGWYNYTWNYPWFYYGSHIGWGGYYPGYNWYWSYYYDPFYNPYGIGMGWGYPYGWGSYYGWGGYPGVIHHYHHYPKKTYPNGQHSGAYYSYGRPDRIKGGVSSNNKLGKGRYDRLQNSSTQKNKLGSQANKTNDNWQSVKPGRTGRANRDRNVEAVTPNNSQKQNRPVIQQNQSGSNRPTGRNVRSERQNDNNFSTSSRNNNSGGFSSPPSRSSSGSTGGGGRSGRGRN
ncbi:hypothetical protein HQ50_01680 [Porphyromonas sp. COT-052 OH4946]|uniref:hypothetical protein n=1 Tax=Porphyromonas sp. COT-052 OH4946 TaxID=1515618 RepID=UPI00051DE8EF|nr:hypothetical protein HQ50_01680 [Porphyromonas sp. COT-052 OH4946]